MKVDEIINAVKIHKVKHELIKSSLLFERGRYLISEILNPSNDNIARKFIEDIIAEANPTSSDE